MSGVRSKRKLDCEKCALYRKARECVCACLRPTKAPRCRFPVGECLGTERSHVYEEILPGPGNIGGEWICRECWSAGDQSMRIVCHPPAGHALTPSEYARLAVLAAWSDAPSGSTSMPVPAPKVEATQGPIPPPAKAGASDVDRPPGVFDVEGACATMSPPPGVFDPVKVKTEKVEAAVLEAPPGVHSFPPGDWQTEQIAGTSSASAYTSVGKGESVGMSGQASSFVPRLATGPQRYDRRGRPIRFVSGPAAFQPR